jgi:hypothetical protein
MPVHVSFSARIPPWNSCHRGIQHIEKTKRQPQISPRRNLPWKRDDAPTLKSVRQLAVTRISASSVNGAKDRGQVEEMVPPPNDLIPLSIDRTSN